MLTFVRSAKARENEFTINCVYEGGELEPQGSALHSRTLLSPVINTSENMQIMALNDFQA